MPLYDYECQECHAVFEVRATFKEKEQGLKPKCAKCQSKKTRQVLLTSGLFMVHGNDECSGACGPNCGCCR